MAYSRATFEISMKEKETQNGKTIPVQNIVGEWRPDCDGSWVFQLAFSRPVRHEGAHRRHHPELRRGAVQLDRGDVDLGRCVVEWIRVVQCRDGSRRHYQSYECH